MVGASRFELLTPGPPCQCATRLRHAPMCDRSAAYLLQVHVHEVWKRSVVSPLVRMGDADHRQSRAHSTEPHAGGQALKAVPWRVSAAAGCAVCSRRMNGAEPTWCHHVLPPPCRTAAAHAAIIGCRAGETRNRLACSWVDGGTRSRYRPGERRWVGPLLLRVTSTQPFRPMPAGAARSTDTPYHLLRVRS
jgi:hypothetical protein